MSKDPDSSGRAASPQETQPDTLKATPVFCSSPAPKLQAFPHRHWAPHMSESVVSAYI